MNYRWFVAAVALVFVASSPFAAQTPSAASRPATAKWVAPRTPDGRPVDVVRAGRQRVDVRLALGRLTELVGPLRFVQVEGGPHLNGSLLDADCVDELNMTVAPVLVGGDGGRLTAGAAPAAHRFDLGHLAVDELSFTFTRWLRHRDR